MCTHKHTHIYYMCSAGESKMYPIRKKRCEKPTLAKNTQDPIPVWFRTLKLDFCKNTDTIVLKPRY